MLRGTRLLVVLLVVLLAGACGDDGGEGDVEPLTREQGVDVLLQQGYTPEGADCIIDRAKDQDVDVLVVFNRDQITERELQVMATIQQFCLRELGTGATVPTVTPSVPAGTPSDSTVTSVG